MTVTEANGNAVATEAAPAASKPKRVRTGCLTCRERHLKCDEALPHCNNCRKSNRVCKRGLKLNFIDTQVQSPPHIVTADEWKVSFLDESREIAAEYQGGLGRYGARESEPDNDPVPVPQPIAQPDGNARFDYTTTAPPAPSMSYQALPPIQGILPEGYSDEIPQTVKYNPPQDPYHHNTHSTTNDSPFSGQNTVQGSTTTYSHHEQEVEPDEKREFLDSQEEVLFMQVFVEEVGLWMDSMDSMKHVSRL